jgi:hypothetical protein
MQLFRFGILNDSEILGFKGIGNDEVGLGWQFDPTTLYEKNGNLMKRIKKVSKSNVFWDSEATETPKGLDFCLKSKLQS